MSKSNASKVKGLLTQERLKQLLSYNKLDGTFTWIVNVSNVRVGTQAGAPHAKGYTHIRIDRKHYLAHRLAWLYEYGEWPKDQLDHINRNKKDNRICNLRDVSGRENQCNNSRNTSGFPGVSWMPKRGKWRAAIHIDGKNTHLGEYLSVERASVSYRLARLWLERQK